MDDPRTQQVIQEFQRVLLEQDRRLARVERGNRRPQLAHSSLEEGQSLEVRGPSGETRTRIGWLPDGTVGMVTEGGDPVSAPTAPTVTPSLGGLRVTWDGQLAGDLAIPGDFDHMAVHISTSSGFTPSAATYVGAIRRAGDGGMLPVIPLPYVEHYVVLVPVTTGGIQGTPSAEASGTPLQSGAADLQAGSVEAVHIAAGAVTAEKLQAILVLASTIVGGDPAAARVELDQDGLRGYNTEGALIFAIDSTGNAIFTGQITGSTVTGSEVIVGDPAGAHARLHEPLPGEPELYMVGSTGSELTISASNVPSIDLGPALSSTQPYITMFAYPDSTGWLNRSPSGAAVDVRTNEATAQVIVNAPASDAGLGSPGPGVVYGLRKSVGDIAALSIQGAWQVLGTGANRKAMIDLESANENRDATQTTYFAAQHVFAGGIDSGEIETTEGVVSIGTTHSLLAPRHAPLRTDMITNPNFAITGDFVAMSADVMPALVFTTGWSGRVRIDITAAGYNNNSTASSIAIGFTLSGGSAVAADLKRCWYAGGHDNPDSNTRTLHMDLAALSEYTLTPHYRISSGGPATAMFDLAFEQSIAVTPLW